jgi:hypothetical protein
MKKRNNHRRSNNDNMDRIDRKLSRRSKHQVKRSKEKIAPHIIDDEFDESFLDLYDYKNL